MDRPAAHQGPPCPSSTNPRSLSRCPPWRTPQLAAASPFPARSAKGLHKTSNFSSQKLIFFVFLITSETCNTCVPPRRCTNSSFMASRFDKAVMTGMALAALNNVVSAYYSGFPTEPAARCRGRHVHEDLPQHPLLTRCLPGTLVKQQFSERCWRCHHHFHAHARLSAANHVSGAR